MHGRSSDDRNQGIVLETGIYNLTKDKTSALVHYGKKKSQSIGLVRLDEAKDNAAAGGQ